MKIHENVPISELTTMRLGGAARYVLTVEDKADIPRAYEFAREKNLPVWVMGGGANTIGHDEGFPGVIILNGLRGIFIQQQDELKSIDSLQADELDDEILLTGMGGEVWDDFVKLACELKYTGIEALSAIPGTLGAAPVQNIGAYGQEIAQVIQEVEAYDTFEREFIKLQKSEMWMSYRETRFNTGIDAGRFLIVSVTVRLQKGELKKPFYNSLQRHIDQHGETDFSPLNIRHIVATIRQDKLPDPKVVASAGSFFKNVLVDEDEANKAEAKGIPVWRLDDSSGKINSGWLIEACGLKGQELYGFRVSEKAALVLINESAKSYANLAKARATIVDAVKAKFGYTLRQEPVEIPGAKQ